MERDTHPYYCIFCNEYNLPNNSHDICYEFKLFQIKKQQDFHSNVFDILQKLYEYIDLHHEMQLRQQEAAE